MTNIAAYARTIATAYLGEPNPKFSNGKELRWGTNGSMSLDLASGTWYSFEDQEGGGVVDLVRRHEGAALKSIPELLEKRFGIARRDQGRLEPREWREAIYRYVDEDGEIVAEVERRVYRDGSKRFLQYRYEAGRRVAGIKGIEMPLYRLPDLLARPDEPVFVVEGEKCVHALSKLGLLATTASQGCNGWRPHHAKHLNGRNIVVLPDNDEAGEKYANAVIASLDKSTTRIKIAHLPDLEEKQDVVDFLSGGKTVEDLLEIVRGAPVVFGNPENFDAAPSPDHAETEAGEVLPDTFEVLDIRAVRAKPPVEWLVDGVLPDAEFSVLYGPPGAGKSFAALDIALHVAAGRAWHGKATKQGAVLYIAGEGVGGMGQRLKAWQLANAVKGNPPFFVVPQAVAMVDSEQLAKLIATIDRLAAPLSLVVIDTVARSLVGEDENDAKAMGVFVEAAETVKRHCRAAVLGIHHSGKDVARGLRGSSSLLAGVYASIKTERNGDLLTLKVEKQKDAEQGEPLSFELAAVAIVGGSSLVLRPARDAATPGGRENPKGTAGLVLDVLRELCAFDERYARGERPHIEEWVAACRERYPDHKASTLSSARQRLVDRGFVFISAEKRCYLG